MRLSSSFFTLGVLLSLLGLPVSVFGQITFNFSSGTGNIDAGAALDDLSFGTFATGGITLSAEAFLDGVSVGTVFNGAGSGWGINAAGGGDQTQRFDKANGLERMVFSFDTAGTFNTIDLREITNAAEAVLSFAGGGTYELFNGSSLEISALNDTYTIGEAFTAGQQITLSLSASAVSNEDFGLESFTVSAIPEPSTYALLFGGLVLGTVVWKRRNRSLSAA